MNFSPLNDPGFLQHREQEKIKAAKKRRRKALIALVTVTLIIAAAFALLVLAAREAFPGFLAKMKKSGTTDAPTVQTETVPATEPPSEKPTDPATVTPAGSETPLPTTQSEEPTTETPVIVHKTTVYVDPGHGFLNGAGDAMDLGATGTLFTEISAEVTGKEWNEADINLVVALKIKALLEEEGYAVIMSREDYAYERLPINARAAKAKSAGADLLVSTHGNTAAQASARGARVFYNNDENFSRFYDCKQFAQTVATNIDALGASSKKATINEGSNLAMLNGTGDIPSILVEMFFLTNEDDCRQALTEEWQDSMAKAIVNAITTLYPLKTTFE